MTITKDKVVSMTYTLTDDEGKVIDQSGDSPLVYLHGHKNIVPGLEKALDGLAVGANATAKVPPSEGYGEYDPKLKFAVDRNKLGDQIPPEGSLVQLTGGSGQEFVARVIEVTDAHVGFDANHPLAGQNLNFNVTIKEVRAANAEEIAHGHVHGPGGHQH